MDPIVSTDITLSLEGSRNEYITNLTMRVRYSMTKDGTVLLYGVYLIQKDLMKVSEPQDITTNSVNIISWLTLESYDEIQNIIRETFHDDQNI